MAKKVSQKAGKAKGKAGKNSSSATQPAATQKKSSVSSESTTVDPGFTEVKRRKRLPRASKKDDQEEYFRSLGLEVRKINGDGNCLFRAFADQLVGSEGDHNVYRKMIVQHLIKHKDEFAGFHEQEEEKSFDDRLKKLAKSGSYGGQECLVAFARIYQRVVYVHQPDDKITLQLPPCQSPDLSRYKQVHILYTGGNHYDSIRLLGDSSRSSASVLCVVKGESISYSADKRPDVVIPDPVWTAVDSADELSCNIDTPPPEEEEEEEENQDGEKDSAIGSECGLSVSSSGSVASESENGDNPTTPGVQVPVEEMGIVALPLPETTVDPQTDVLLAEPNISVSPEMVEETEVLPTEPAPKPTESSSKPSKPLSKKQKRTQKKQANQPAPFSTPTVGTPLPDQMATITSSLGQFRLVSV